MGNWTEQGVSLSWMLVFLLYLRNERSSFERTDQLAQKCLPSGEVLSIDPKYYLRLSSSI